MGPLTKYIRPGKYLGLLPTYIILNYLSMYHTESQLPARTQNIIHCIYIFDVKSLICNYQGTHCSETSDLTSDDFAFFRDRGFSKRCAGIQ